MVRARFVVLMIPFLLLTSAIIAQEPAGLLVGSRINFEIADGALPSEGAADYFGEKKCRLQMAPTPEAIHAWNESGSEVIGLFHITC